MQMLDVKIAENELFDEDTLEFHEIKPCIITIEHSLDSIRRWEALTKKAFMSRGPLSRHDLEEYTKCMTLNKVDPLAYKALTNDDVLKITSYMDDVMTATTFSDIAEKKQPSGILTAEIIYYWMTVLNIPFECQYWHLNQLLTLIKVCDRKQNPPKKIRGKKLMARNAKINAMRRQKMGSRG